MPSRRALGRVGALLGVLALLWGLGREGRRRGRAASDESAPAPADESSPADERAATDKSAAVTRHGRKARLRRVAVEGALLALAVVAVVVVTFAAAMAAFEVDPSGMLYAAVVLAVAVSWLGLAVARQTVSREHRALDRPLRNATVLVMVLAALAGWVAVSERAPPAEASGPAHVGFFMPGVSPPIGTFEMNVRVQAPKWSLLGGCPDRVLVTVELAVPDNFLDDVRGRTGVLAVAGESLSGLSAVAVPDARQTSAPDRRYLWSRSLFSVPVGIRESATLPRARVEVEFRAAWVASRGFGACWVLLPTLSDRGDSRMAAQFAARKLGHSIDRIFTEDHVVSGTSSVQGGRVDAQASVPPPTGGDGSWQCEASASRSISSPRRFSACAAWAAVDAPWRDSLQDLALVLCGAFLSLGVGLILRAAEPLQRSRG